jgi:DegV family protein with EDD domain
MLRGTAVVTDSTADLTVELQEAHGITVVPLNIHFGQESFRDRVDLAPGDFMAKMSTSDRLPTTSQPSVGAFEEAFRSFIGTHAEIVCPVISSRLSGTCQSATLAAAAVASEIPVTVVDTNSVSAGLGHQAIEAARLASEGGSAEDIATSLRAESYRHHIVFFVETLEHLRRGGRIGKAAQLLGSMLQLRPLLRLEEGQIVPFERTRTRSKAIAAVVEFTREFDGIDVATVLYNTTPEDAEALAAQIATVMKVESIPTVQVGPVVSAHVGPGILGVALKEAARV